MVHRKGEELLRAELPRKMEHIISLQLTPAQHAVYEAYLKARGAGRGGLGLKEAWGRKVLGLERAWRLGF